MAATDTVSVGIDGDVAWVTIDNPPVNATSQHVRAGLLESIGKVANARVAILSCVGKTFVAGGDMSEFNKPPIEPHLPDVIQALENSKTPFVAAMHGTVLGGGFEIALGCAWRIAVPDTRFGLPEVNVGLIPGAGGTQRLPRLIGMAAAIDIACTGKPVTAQDLFELGGLDQVVSGDPRTGALTFVRSLPDRPTPISQRVVTPLSPNDIQARADRISKSARGQVSPLKNLTALQWSTLPFADGMARERAEFMALRDSDESKALRHAFFAERAVSKPTALAGATPQDIKSVAIVGGGLMGAGISASCLSAGLRVVLLETSAETADQAHNRVTGLIDGALKRGKIGADARGAQLERFSVTTDIQDTASVDMVIEAVFEDLTVKQSVFQNLGQVVGKHTILATNTSYLDPRDIFQGVANPSRCLGLHFFSPAHIMRLLEIIRMPETDPGVLATAFALARRLRKVGVLAGICDGFIGNRMLSAYRRQADYMLADGALPHQVDAAMREFGMPMGPYELQDLTGLQIGWANRKRLAPLRDPAERYIPIADQLCEQGRLGQRSGKGWYQYDAGQRTPIRDPAVETLIEQYSQDQGISRQSFSPDAIRNRMVTVLINEGALIVQEGVAETPAAVDMVQIHGYGFPRWRGGPMQYAKAIGLKNVSRTMDDVMDQSPHSWRRADLLA